MIRLLFVFINFNNSDFTIELICSILSMRSLNNFHVVIVDNHSNNKDISNLKNKFEKLEQSCISLLLLDENIGYFSGLNQGIVFAKKNKINFTDVVIGNNDLVFDRYFYDNFIENYNKLINYPVVCPRIISFDGIDQNPHVIDGITTFRKFIYSLYFSSFFMSKIIDFISNKINLKRKDTKLFFQAQEIKMGYGACYILTQSFFDHFKYLDDKVFLLGEEAILSNQINSKGLKMYYEPSLIVRHAEHASMNKILSRKKWEIGRDSYRIYKKYL